MPRAATLAGIFLAVFSTSLTAQSAGAPPSLWLSLPLPDSSASGGVVPRVAIRNLPVDDPRHALILVPGVTLRGGDIGIGVPPVLSIRGAPSEPQVLVDGVPVRLQTFGTQGLGIDANALESAAVLTGVAPVTVPDAGAGVIAYRTRSGGERLDADVRWSSDEPFGDAMSVGFNHLTGSASGPLGARLRFAASVSLLGQRSQYRGPGAADVPVLVPAGSDTTVEFASGDLVTIPRFADWDGGVRRPFDWSSARRLHGRVEYALGEGAALSFTALASDLQQRFFPGQRLLVPNAYAGARATAAVGIASLRQRLGAALLTVSLSYARESDASGALDVHSEVSTRDPYLGIEFGTLEFIGQDLLPPTETLVRNVRTNSGVRAPFLNRSDLLFVQPHRVNPYGMLTGWPTRGIQTLLSTSSEKRFNGAAVIEWTPGRHHLTLGLDGERSTVELYTSNILSQAFMDVFAEHPTRTGAFASDRLALPGGGVLDLGLRFDRYAPGGEFPKTPGRIYSNPNWSFNAASDDTAYTASVARVFTNTRSQSFLSPGLRAVVPLAPRASLHLGYGKSVEPPEWATFFRQVNSDLDFTTTSSPFGRDVDFATTSMMEIGARVDLAPEIALDGTLYRRDGHQYVNRIQPFADPLNVGDTINLVVLTTVEDNVPWGIEGRVSWRGSDWLGGTAAYAFGKREFGGASITTHVVSAGVEAHRFGIDALALFRARSGDPYSRFTNSGMGTITPSFVIGPGGALIGVTTLPWTKTLDLRVGKTLRAGGRDWQVFADIRNLFNFRNVRALFAETGDVTNDVYRQQRLGTEFAFLVNEAISNSALEAGNTINLTACGTWSDPANCVALTRVERHFGDGDGHYTTAEQQSALYAFYESQFGAWSFYGPGRTLRVGAQLEL